MQTVDYGRPATLTCNPEGNPIKSISWMKDGVAISHTDNVLRIEQVRREDKGMYQCFVRNDQESAQASAELKLGGRCKTIILRGVSLTRRILMTICVYSFFYCS